MNSKRIMTIAKVIAIIIVLVSIAFVFRANAYNISAIPEDQKGIFTDDSGLPYFSEMDSYYNLRLTQNYVNNGHFGDTLVNGSIPWDNHSYGPPGREAAYTPLIAYVTSAFYDIANMFMNVELKEVAFWTGAIFASFCGIPAYILVRRITNDWGGISAALLVSLAPNYFLRTFAGFFDTDMFNIIFPLFAILFFLESIKSKNTAYQIIFAILSVASLAIFSLAWTGYIFYIALIVIFVIVYLILGKLLKMNVIESTKKYSNKLQWFIHQRELFVITLFIIIGFVGLVAVNGFDAVVSSITGLAGATQLQALGQGANTYPNVYVSVSELQIPNLLFGGINNAFLANSGGVINGIGGMFTFLCGLATLYILGRRYWDVRKIKSKYSGGKLPKSERKGTLEERKNASKGPIGGSDALKIKKDNFLYLTFFGTWIILAIIAVSQGTRFIQVIILPFGICAGIFVGICADYIKSKWKDSDKKDNKLTAVAVGLTALTLYPILVAVVSTNLLTLNLAIIVGVVLSAFIGILFYGIKKVNNLKRTIVIILLLFAVVSPTVAGAYQASASVVPGTDDAMWKSMEWVKTNQSVDTVISSWWDYGHMFAISADRRITFDGGSQNTPRAFWIGRALSTDNETLSVGILEMLSTSGDQAYTTLDKYTNNSGKSAEILLKTLGVPREEARTIMTDDYNLSSATANEVIKYSHPTNPEEVILVASSDMIGKSYWWTKFGMWDFVNEKKDGYQYMQFKNLGTLEKSPNGGYNTKIVNFEDAISRVETKITKGTTNNTTNAEVQMVYTNGSIIKDKDGKVYNPFSVNRMMIIEDGQLIKNETVNETGDYFLLVFGNNGTYYSYVMNKELENAMFTKLFILGGFGQNSFELVKQENGAFIVQLWKVKESGNANTTTNN
ncbi:MAG: STT3 domain-containing protein [Methanobacteriaceae archaeon]